MKLLCPPAAALVLLLASVCPAVATSSDNPFRGPELAAARTCTHSRQVGVVGEIDHGLAVKQSQKQWQKAKVGTPLYQNESIRTGRGQKAGIVLCDGGNLYINQQSKAFLQTSATQQLQQGQLAESGGKGPHTLLTQNARARGSRATFSVTQQQRTSTFTVLKGAVQVSNSRGQVTVHQNEQSSVRPQQAPQRPRAANAKQQLAWTAPLSVHWQAFAGFDGPGGVAVDSGGNVYVADDGNHQILKLSPSGSVLARWGTQGFGPGQFENPFGVALDSHGNVYVSDFGTDRITKLSPTGQPIGQWGATGSGPGQLNGPFFLAVDGHDDVYVADWQNNRIQKFAPDGTPLAQWGSQGDGPGQFLDPTGVAVDRSGNVYVADWGNGRVQKLSPDGGPVASWGTGLTGPHFKAPYGIAVDRQGNVYVADSVDNRITEVCAGRQLGQWGGTYGHELGQFASPAGVAIDNAGTIYVTDSGNSRLQKLARTGSTPVCS